MAATAQPAAAPQHDGEEYQQQLDNIFSLKRPRDIKAGLASGGKSALKGIAAGTVGLFAAPVVGAYTDGFKGFGQGVAAGEFYGSVFTMHCSCLYHQVVSSTATANLGRVHSPKHFHP